MNMKRESHGLRRTWRRKFADAFRGLYRGVWGETSFGVHLLAAALVVLAGAMLRVTAGDWCVLVLAMTLVLCAEMLNSSLETLAAALHPEHHPEIGEALDIASAAVLIAALGAAVLGLIVLLPRLWPIFLRLWALL